MGNTFYFKQFSIQQNLSAMKVGTDGVLLGAWANCYNANNILDIGTGTGLISMMLAQRCNARITAIEIEEKAYTEALINTKNCKWNERILVKKTSLQNFKNNCTEKFDLIICNPPFFKNSKKNNSKEKTIARHSIALSTEELISFANLFLTENGVLSVIIPYDIFEDYKTNLKKHNLHIIRMTKVKPTPEKQVKRLLLEFSRNRKEYTPETLIIEEFGRHLYSNKYKNMTSEFYLFK